MSLDAFSQEEKAANARREGAIKPSDYLQAFTHFSYRFTNRKVMVCDLQGVFDTDTIPPTFELSDPVIHYASKSGNRLTSTHVKKSKKRKIICAFRKISTFYSNFFT
jgi:hypothetical protein